MNNIIPPYPGGQNRSYDAVNNIFEKVSINNANAIAGNVFKSPFAMTKEQHTTFQRMIEPRILCYDANLKNHPHPIPALLNKYSYEEFHKIAEKVFSKHGHYSIDIGGSIEADAGRHIHVCPKITNLREKNRYTNAYLRCGKLYDARQVLSNEQMHCHQGSEHCNFQATYAFSVNANYDITLDTVCDFFRKHGIITYDVAMYLPSILIDKRINLPSEYYTINIKGDEIDFHLNDYSFVYTHDYDTWRAYMTNTVIDAGEFSLVAEITSNIKDYCHIRFTRVDQRKCTTKQLMVQNTLNAYVNNFANLEKIKRVIPIARIYGENYLLPDIIGYIRAHKSIRDINERMLIVNKEFVDGVLKWALSATDDQFKYNSFGTWARSQSASLTYDVRNLNLAIFHGYSADINTYDDVIQNLFVYAAVQRLHRTKNVGRAFRAIKKSSEQKEIVREIKSVIKEWIDPIVPDFHRILKSLFHVDHIIDKVYSILDIKIKYLDSVTFRGRFNAITFDQGGNINLDYDERVPLIPDSPHINPDKGALPGKPTEATDTIIPSTPAQKRKIEEEKQGCKKSKDDDTTHECREHNDFKFGQCALQAIYDYMRHECNKEQTIFVYNDADIDEFLKGIIIHDQREATYLERDSKDMKRIVNKTLNRDSTWLIDVEIAFFAFINKFNLQIITRRKEGDVLQMHVQGQNRIMTLMHEGAHYYYARKIGGGRVVHASNNLINLRRLKETPNFKLNVDHTDQKAKMFELYTMILQFARIDSTTRWHDLSCAPGVFAELLIKQCVKYTLHHYVGHGSQAPMKSINSVPYKRMSDIHQHIRDNDISIFDMDIGAIDTESHVMKTASQLITKYDPYKVQSPQVVNFINGFQHKKIFLLDASRRDSAETYIYLDSYPHADVDDCKDLNDTLQDQIEKHEVQIKKTDSNDNEVNKKYESFFDSKLAVRGDIKELQQLYESHFRKIVNCNAEYVIKARVGVAGAAKTQGLLEFKGENDHIISPILNEKLISYTVYIDKLANQKVKPRRIIIDEIFAMDPVVIALIAAYGVENDIEIYGMGDNQQISYFKVEEYMNYNHRLEILELIYHEESKRIIPQAAKLLQHRMPNLTTTNQKGNFEVASDISEQTRFDMISRKDQTRIITFGKDFKRMLAENGFATMTAHESQSLTLSSVIVHTGDLHVIKKEEQFRYAYTAISRSSNRLVLYGSNSELSVFLTVLGSSLEEALSLASPLINTTQIIKPVDDTINNERIEIDNAPVDVNMVDQILQKTVLNTNPRNRNDIQIRPKMLPKCERKMKINVNHVNAPDITVTGATLSNFAYTRKDQSKDAIGTLMTFIKRYATDRKIPYHLEQLTRGVEVFIDTEKMRNRATDPEELYKHTIDHLIELQRKVNDPKHTYYKKTDVIDQCDIAEALKEEKKSIFDVCEKFIDCLSGKANSIKELEMAWHEASARTVSFIMKKQDKHIIEHAKDEQFKAGQGVAAWTKIMNAVFSGYIRYAQSQLFDSARPNVIFAYNKSDADIGEFFSKFTAQFHDDRYVNTDNDFQECDASHSESSILNEMLIMRSCGMPQMLRNLYHDIRKEFMMMYNNGEGVSKLYGAYTLHSGQPFTLGSNTLINISAVGASVSFGEILYAAFKGDDSTIKSTESKDRYVGTGDQKKLLSKSMGYKFKMTRGRVSEFIANIITPYGFFPDVLRRTTKTISRIYENEDQWEESRVNILESIRCVKNNHHKQVGASVCSEYYRMQNIIISSEEILTLYDYLTQLSKMKYEKLDFVNIRNFIIHYTNNYLESND